MSQDISQPSLTAIGLMSGTSMDGVDAAVVRSDGTRIEAFGPSLTVPYPPAFRDRLRSLIEGGDAAAADRGAVESELTDLHAEVVARLLADADDVHADLIGFHGHTVLHDPEHARTVQIGDGARLAQRTGLPVVNDFRSADVAAGGQGAPLASILHAALAQPLPRPVVVLNVGGVANATWIGPSADDLLAFDTGPGNALIDDWMRQETGQAWDTDGRQAAAGVVDEALVAQWMRNPYFDLAPPKSLDRNDFAAVMRAVAGKSTEDGAATLTAFTIETVAAATRHFPAPPKRWIVCGGGRLNAVLMEGLARRLDAPVEAAEALGWNGDAIEAQAFAYMAVRAMRGLAISFPGTTGVPRPMTGGQLHQPQ